MDFIEFTLKIYEDRIREMELSNFKSISRKELYEILKEASAMKKFMFDNKEEGYHETFDYFVTKLNVINRLQTIIDLGMGILDIENEEKHFYLYPKKSYLNIDINKKNFVEYELNQYLDMLTSLDRNLIDMSIVNQYPEWIKKTENLLNEMKGYLTWVVDKSCNKNFICLLRDTLIHYIGLKERNYEVVPIMVGRKYLEQYDRTFYYDFTIDILYEVLNTKINSHSDLLKDFRKKMKNNIDKRSVDVKNALINYLDRSLLSNGYTIIESGVQGTIPLTLYSLDERINGFFLYTTLPWLNHVYKDIIYCDNYNYLREMETLICQDFLFEFAFEKDRQIYIKEFQNNILKNLAYYELVRYKELLVN
ncbi:hypothetical protein RI065_00610 [Mycoplasmatota bacterium zrk1]